MSSEPGAVVPGPTHTLYVVPTPIGNLEDVTLRALRTLREVDLIVAEDTRRTRILLQRYDIHTPMRAYHQHNKRSALTSVLRMLGEGDVGLVSDAGMPAVSDPGYELIAAAVQEGIAVDVLPGPSAASTAIVGAAIPAPGFLTLGFPPRKRGDRRALLASVKALPYSLVFYEAPRRLLPLLEDVVAVLGERWTVVGRELTKVHQEYVRGGAPDLVARFTAAPARGECTVVVAGATEEPQVDLASVLEEVKRRARAGEMRRDVFEDVSQRFDVSRSDMYAAWMTARDALDDSGARE